MTETPKYKLYYFEFRSRAEPTRLIFAKAGLPFTDVRIAIDQWDEFKQSQFSGTLLLRAIAWDVLIAEMPMGQVPVLEIVGSGEQIWQGTAIARFVARETGLAGKTSLEAARADALVEGVFDLWTAAGTFYMAKMNNEKEKEVAEWAKFKANKLVSSFKNFKPCSFFNCHP